MADGMLRFPAEARSMSLARAAVRKDTRRTSLSVGIPRTKFDDIADVVSEVGSELDNDLMHEAPLTMSTFTARSTLNYSSSTQRSCTSNNSWDTSHTSLPPVVNRLGRITSNSQGADANNFQIAACMQFDETFLQDEFSSSFQYGRIVVGGAASLLKGRLTKANAFALRSLPTSALRLDMEDMQRDYREALFAAAQEDPRMNACPSSASVAGSQAGSVEEPTTSFRLPAIPRGNAFRRHCRSSNADEREKET